ncbi:MAG TPA: hypothetical protein VIK48_00705, partial [Candidatus Manganitrophaceae bacterium]
VQGFTWWGLNPFIDSVRFSMPFWWVRTLTGLMITAGILVFLYNLWRTALGKPAYFTERVTA